MTSELNGKPGTALLLHAYPLNASMWNEQQRALQGAGLHVIAPDLSGFGRAHGAMTTLGDTAKELLQQLPVGPLSMVGLSMGGYLAMQLLALAPERFGRVVLADTTLRADPPEKVEDRRQQADRVLEEGKQFILDAARAEHSPATFRLVEPMIQAASPEGIAGALRAMAVRSESRSVLSALRVPLLVLVGADDPITPPETAQEIADAGHGMMHVIPEARHLSNLDQPEAFNRELLAFLT